MAADGAVNGGTPTAVRAVSAQDAPGAGGRSPGVRTIGVAIPIPDPYGPWLQRMRASFGDPLADAIPTHITLLPPTEIPEAALDAVVDHLAEAARGQEPFRIRLRGTATFRPVSPVVFVALAEGIGGCERLHSRVVSGPLERELSFPYHPHVTVAHHLPDEALDRAFKELADYRADFRADGFALYEHGADGVWRPVNDFAFRPPRGR
ncbi:2'-5' RNA ligase family protein [Actinomadura kijaniata]|uniref:2'-5' RNA ligase family protein n=1 Tax=Actinomadura kijaniata TaxID=46161 RepID=UPI000AE32FBE|nr:2'-5' RNA ligase family protein [Actinomadura kijaniata]